MSDFLIQRLHDPVYDNYENTKVYFIEQGANFYRVLFWEKSDGYSGIIRKSDLLGIKSGEVLGIVYPNNMFTNYTAEYLKTHQSLNYMGKSGRQGLNWLISKITGQMIKDYLRIGDENGFYDPYKPPKVGDFLDWEGDS
jgi:hypothetical protein